LTEQEADAWYQRQVVLGSQGRQQPGWLVGCNYIPKTAINPIEMWQDGTFDPNTIEEELRLAEGLGFNSVRVFLHILPWQNDRDAFFENVRSFLDIAKRHNIGVMFVLFDSVWDPHPVVGQQPRPRPRLHNPGWVQCPGLRILTDQHRHEAELKGYVQDVIREVNSTHASSVQVWDLFNEPDNINRGSYDHLEPNQRTKEELALKLLRNAMGWAREVNPPQPLTSGVWHHYWSVNHQLTELEEFQIRESDVITFHNYEGPDEMKNRVRDLRDRLEPQLPNQPSDRDDPRPARRPILCTEYMGRPHSTFEGILPVLRVRKVGAYNWGFVSGDTQTIYHWDSWQRPESRRDDESNPSFRWFHDIYRADGRAFDDDDIRSIMQATGR
jgi:hypothetical protein